MTFAYCIISFGIVKGSFMQKQIAVTTSFDQSVGWTTITTVDDFGRRISWWLSLVVVVVTLLLLLL